MATVRGTSSSYDVGSKPPEVRWTFVRGDTASFKVYVTDDDRQPLNIPDWTIQMKVKRPVTAGIITDNATLIHTVNPSADADDLAGEVTVFLSAEQTNVMQTGDIFDIQLSLPQDEIVWTVCQGSVTVLEDVTD